MVVGDFNGDSDPDLAPANNFSDNVSVLLGPPGRELRPNDQLRRRQRALSRWRWATSTATRTTTWRSPTILRQRRGALNALNRRPGAADEAYATDEDTPLELAAGVLGNDSDRDGDVLTAVLMSGPAHGTRTLNPDGSLRYTPDPDFNGSDSFRYRTNDSKLDSEPATVTIEVKAVEDPGSPAGTTPPPAPAASTQAALGQLRLAPRCVRRARSGRVRIQMTLRTAQPWPLQVPIDRAVGTGARHSCPRPNPERRFTGHFRKVATLSQLPARPAPAAATLARRLTLRLHLAPGLYRITVRAQLGSNRLSAPARRYPRVLG